MLKVKPKLARRKQQAEQAWQQGDAASAERQFAKYCEAVKGDTDAWIKYAVVLSSLGRAADAVRALRHVLKRQPQDSAALHNLSLLLIESGQARDALQTLQQWAGWDTRNAEIYFLRGLANEELSDVPAALADYTHATELNPGYAEAWNNLGRVQQESDNDAAAQQAVMRAYGVSGGQPQFLESLIQLLANQGRFDDALDALQSHTRQHGDGPETAALAGYIHHKQGDKARAQAAIQPFIQQRQVTPTMLQVYARLANDASAISDAINGLTFLLDRQQLDSHQATESLFLLGRLFEKQADYDQAFSCFQRANRLAIRAGRSDVLRLFDDSACINRMADPALPRCETPVLFIVGMPRSGTSLLEQILAAHSGIAAQGELPWLPRIAAQLREATADDAITPATITTIGGLLDNYRNAFNAAGDGCRYITDKLPTNFLYLPLIRRLFPNAHIIHSQRHAMDTCLSCYCSHFGAVTHRYSYDLEDLASYYQQYRQRMADVDFTGQPVYAVSYAALVSDLRNTIAPLLAGLDLEWEAGCADFAQYDRFVKTASYDQVRQPLYATSVGRWKHYQRHLAIWKEMLPED